MSAQNRCIVGGCSNKVHAKGYCRKHYGQIWRKGRVYEIEEEITTHTDDEIELHEESDRVRALERELRRAEMMYRNVIGLEGRLKWRREINEVKQEMDRLGIKSEAVGAAS